MWHNKLLISRKIYQWLQSSREIFLFNKRFEVTDESFAAAMKILQEIERIVDYQAIDLALLATGKFNMLKEKR